MEVGEWFDDSEYDTFDEFDDTSTFQLRDWQRRAKQYFSRSNGKAIFEVTTGAGKTFLALDIINDILKQEPNINILIVVPKNVILETGWYKELTDYGFPIQNIGVYYGEIKEYAQITLTNMQNINRVPMEMFDALIIDEAHNMCTPRMMHYVQQPFRYKIGLTATLKRLDNKHLDLLSVFDYNTFKYTPEEAMYEGILNPFDFVNIGVSLDIESYQQYDELTQFLNNIFRSGGGYEKIMKSNSPQKMQMLSLINERKALVNNYPEKFNIAREIINHHKDNKIIVFNQFNDQTSRMYWYLLEDEIKCRIIHSGVSKEKREQNLIDFRNNKFNVLLTSKVLDEGYNLPKLDVAIIMAGDSTDKQTVQRMGRVLRKKEDKNSKLYQIYCKQTIEERAAIERAKLFKDLASHYQDMDYYGEGSITRQLVE